MPMALRKRFLRLVGLGGSQAENDATCDIVVFLVGPTGSGKSTFINVATKSNVMKVWTKLEPCTRVIQSVKCPSFIGKDHPRAVLFVDTPAFDGILTATEVDLLIRDWLSKNVGKKPPKEVGILYLHRISDPKMTAPPNEHLLRFEKLCGGYFNTPLKTVVVTTMWRDKPTEKDAKREAEIKETCAKVCGDRAPMPMFRFLDTQESAEDAVNILLGNGHGISV